LVFNIRLSTSEIKRFETEKGYQIKEILPADIRQNEITVPMTPKSSIMVKFLKNCFFLTWKLTCHLKSYKKPNI